MKTTGAVLWEMGRPRPYRDSRPLTIETLDLEPPGPGEVLVEIKAAGVCHSDLSVINGSRPRPLPMALGHEAAGVVLECGAGVTDLSPGQPVVTSFVPSCGHCRMCRIGRPGLCEPGARANLEGTLLSGARRIQCQGKPVNHHIGVCAFSKHTVAARESLVAVADDIPFNRLALFGCAVMTGAGAVFNTARVPPGAGVAVVGLGGVGLCAVLAADLMGARPLVAVDLNEDKLALARELGATLAVNAGAPDAVEQVRKATDGGVEFAFELAGNVAALELAYKITARGGSTVSAGLAPPDATFALPAVNLVGEERTLRGSYLGSCVPARDIPLLLDLYRNGKLPLDKLVSAELPLADINQAFDNLAEGSVVRQILC